MIKKPGKRKIWKVIVLILLIFVLLIIVLANIPVTKDKITTDNPPEDPRLEDPDLLYASLNSSGMCSNSKGEEGGCYSRNFLFHSGKYLVESGWEGLNNIKETSPAVEKQFTPNMMAKIVKKIKDSNIMSMECPSVQNTDTWFSYQLNLDGVKKFFAASPTFECQKIFWEIDVLIDSAIDTGTFGKIRL